MLTNKLIAEFLDAIKFVFSVYALLWIGTLVLSVHDATLSTTIQSYLSMVVSSNFQVFTLCMLPGVIWLAQACGFAPKRQTAIFMQPGCRI